MTKTKRIELIKSLVTQGDPLDAIIDLVVSESGAAKGTVTNDIRNLYPNGLPLLNDGDGDGGQGDGDQAANNDDELARLRAQLKERDEKLANQEAEIAGLRDATGANLKAGANPEEAKGRLLSYEVPKNETGFIHAEIEETQYSASDGKKISTPRLQKFDLRAWLQFKAQASKLGYNFVKVWHAPEGVDTTIAPMPKGNPNPTN